MVKSTTSGDTPMTETCTLTRLTTSVDSIRIPHLPTWSIKQEESDTSGDITGGEELTKAGLVNYHVAGDEDRVRREALRAFVNVQEGIESVSNVMLQTR